MSDNFIYEPLKKGYDKYPIIRDILIRLCNNYKKTGKLQKTIKIKPTSNDDYTILSLFFENDNVNKNSINLDSFLKTIDKHLFLNSIFDITGINLNNRAGEYNRAKEFLLKLKLCYPNLFYVHEFLNDKLNSNSTIFSKYSYEQFELVCKITSELLVNNNIEDFSTLGSYYCNDSKLIRRGTLLYSLTADFINCEINLGFESGISKEKIFETVGVSDNPTAIKVSLFAPLLYKHKNGTVFDWIKKLWECGESAVLSLDNIQHITECWLELDGEVKMVTCENESPFNFMIRNERYPVIYTAGYPNTAVKMLTALLAKNINQIYHWGDTDLHGLKIADIIGRYCDVKLWNCAIDDVRNNIHKLKKLNADNKVRIENFLTKNPNFKFKKELEFTLKNGWLEQEAFQLAIQYY